MIFDIQTAVNKSNEISTHQPLSHSAVVTERLNQTHKTHFTASWTKTTQHHNNVSYRVKSRLDFRKIRHKHQLYKKSLSN